MNRIAQRFQDCRQQKRRALVPYLVAGDPTPGVTVQLMHTLVEAGADVLEVGVPFSDPMNDGPVIQAGCERALVHDVTLRDVLAMVREFRHENFETPVVLMGYLNPVEVMGYAAFADAAAEAGVDGVLTVDLPPEEADELTTVLGRYDIAPIFLVAPTTTEARLRSICDVARGFIYYVSLKGVTGSARLDVQSVAERLDDIRRCTDLPVGVGFGISDARSAAAVGRVADAVVVGSAIVRRIEENADDVDAMRAALRDLVSSMRVALDKTMSEAAESLPE